MWTNIFECFANAKHTTLYTFFKDFQVLGAAIFALSAALVAYTSAQHVSKRQIQEDRRKNEIEQLRKRLAILHQVRQRLNAIERIVTTRMSVFEAAQSDLDDINISRSVKLLVKMPSIYEQVHFAEITTAGLPSLSAEEQITIFGIEVMLLTEEASFDQLKFSRNASIRLVREDFEGAYKNQELVIEVCRETDEKLRGHTTKIFEALLPLEKPSAKHRATVIPPSSPPTQRPPS